MADRSRDNVSAFPNTPILMPYAEPISSVLEQRVRWLSRGRIALGKITVLDGDPGLGKSTITLEWAARLSRGEALPGGEPLGEPRATLLLSAEDGKGDTIRPRLEAAGADMRKTFRFVLRDEQGNEQLPSIPEDLGALESQIEATNAIMVVIDPLMAYLSSQVKGHNDQDVRRALSPLASLAERTNVAVIVLRHLNKATGMVSMYRGGGSIGIIGAARFGLLVAKDPDDESGQRRVVAVQKCNIGPEPPSISYRLIGVEGTDVARIVWEGDSPHSASALTDAPRTHGERSALKEAEGWLYDALALGEVPVKQLQKQSRDDGIAWRTLEAAKAKMGVVSVRKGFGPGSSLSWRMPLTVGRDRHTPQDDSAYNAESKSPVSSQESHTSHTPERVWAYADPFEEEDE